MGFAYVNNTIIQRSKVFIGGTYNPLKFIFKRSARKAKT